MFLIRRQNGDDIRVERLEQGGPVLGIVEWGNYQQGSIRVEDRDILILFSDGIVEAMNEFADLFGEDRLLYIIQQSANKSPAEIQEAILRAVRTHVGETRSGGDDQTLLVAQFHSVFAGMSPSSIQEIAV
jgi:sigma-B regulation protein RsbU (phosphoserine phosphatase)